MSAAVGSAAKERVAVETIKNTVRKMLSNRDIGDFLAREERGDLLFLQAGKRAEVSLFGSQAVAIGQVMAGRIVCCSAESIKLCR